MRVWMKHLSLLAGALLKGLIPYVGAPLRVIPSIDIVAFKVDKTSASAYLLP